MVLYCSLDMLALAGLACLKTTLNSSASLGMRLWCATSIAVIYSWYGGLGVTEKLGLCYSTVSCATYRGLVGKFTTHHLLISAET